MTTKRRIISAIVLFGLAGTLGPILYFTMVKGNSIAFTADDPPPSLQYYAEESLYTLWPTRILGTLLIFEERYGIYGGTHIVVGANILFFGLVGLLAGMAAKRRGLLAATYLGLGLYLFRGSGGWDPEYFEPVPFLLSMLILLIPFWLTARLARQIDSELEAPHSG